MGLYTPIALPLPCKETIGVEAPSVLALVARTAGERKAELEIAARFRTSDFSISGSGCSDAGCLAEAG